MNPLTALYALQLLQALPGLIATGLNVMSIINQGTTALQNMVAEKRNPSEAEWDALNAVTAELRKQLHSA